MPSNLNVFVAIGSLLLVAVAARGETDRPRPPNIVVILADDLGYGDLGCFGQAKLKTPALDAMAAEGMRFTQFYAGGADDTSSLGVLLTGRHAGHAVTRGGSDRPIALPPGTATVPTVLKAAGYVTACIGERVVGVTETRRDDAPDLSVDDAVRCIRENQGSPFFLLLALTPPAANHDVGRRPKAVDDIVESAERSDWPAAEKAFAAAVHNLDREVGGVLAVLKDLKAERRTLVIFTSDNGPRSAGGHDADFFGSNGKYRGGKGSVNEGGIRVPMIAWWPGTVPPGAENDRQWYAGDLMATAAELAGVKPPDGSDSDSFVAALRGQINPDQWARKSRLCWESHGDKTAQAVRFGKWKALRSPMFTGPVELFDMSNDPDEKRDYSQRRPDLTRHATNLLNAAHQPDPNPDAAFKGDRGAKARPQ